MLKMNYDLEGALKAYLLLLDKEEYFEAHEVLEEAWHPLRKADHPLKNLAKGLINGAIAFEHIKRDRNEAHQKAKKVMASFEFFEEACQKIEALKMKHVKVF
jgi:predicted metal-dependent hydrolase